MTVKSKRKSYIIIQTATKTSDSQGGYTTTWATSFGEWAKTVVSSQSRTLDMGGIKYKMAVEFTIRTGQVVTAANRIVWSSVNYTIHSVIPSSRLGETVIIAYT